MCPLVSVVGESKVLLNSLQGGSAFRGSAFRSPCHEINGVKYFGYVLGSEDFNQRVGKSKFGRMLLFAKSNIGYLVLQGDHGQVSFRNIKLRTIEAKK